MRPQEEGKRVNYSPVRRPNLKTDLDALFDKILGTNIDRPNISNIQTRSRSAKRSTHQLSMRETPRFLRIVASPDDSQEQRLKAELQGDLATLKWDTVGDCVGELARILKESMVPIP